MKACILAAYLATARGDVKLHAALLGESDVHILLVLLHFIDDSKPVSQNGLVGSERSISSGLLDPPGISHLDSGVGDQPLVAV